MATTFDISVIFKAIDNLSPAMKNMQRNIKAISAISLDCGKSIKDMGGSLMKYLTLPIAAFGALGVKEFSEMEDATNKMNQAIKNTGRDGQISVEALKKLSNELQDLTGYEDDASMKALALTQSMSNLSEKQLRDLLPRMQDLSAGMKDMPLEQVASLLGKVFSTGNTSMLKRYGLNVQETNDKELLMSRLLTEIDGKFKGMAKTKNMGISGAMTQLTLVVKDLAAGFGEYLAPMIQKVSQVAIKFKNWLAGFSPQAKKFIYDLLIGLALLAPAIMIIGITLTTVGSMLAANPIGAIITGIALAIMLIIIIIRNWNTIWKVIMKTFNSMPVPLKILLGILLPFISIPLLIIKNWNKIVAIFKTVINTFTRMPRILQIFIGILFGFISIPLLIIRNWKPISEFFGKLWSKISSDASKAFNSIKNFAGNIGGKIKAIWESSGLSDFFGKIWDGFLSGAEKVFNWLKNSLTDMFGELMKNPVIKWLLESPAETKTSGAVNKLQNQVNKSEVTIKVIGDGSAQTTIQDVKNKGTTKTKVTNDNLGYSHP